MLHVEELLSNMNRDSFAFEKKTWKQSNYTRQILVWKVILCLKLKIDNLI